MGQIESNDDIRAELEALKSEVAALKAQKSADADGKLAKKIKSMDAKINKVRAHDANDNIKWGVDLRTSLDSIEYKMADGTTKKNRDLFANRLWLNMAYQPSNKVVFKGQLGYNKAYGADMNNGRGRGYDQFDWVTNEALTGNEMQLRQAYWLYMGDDFLGAGIPWTASLGRRPSTTGFLSHLREDDQAQSPLGHNIDVEFDGGSSLFKLEKVTGISGMSFKICAGQGGTNASPRFSGTDYAGDSTTGLDDIRLAGFIFVPYDNGTLQVKTNAFKAFNLPGISMNNNGEYMTANGYASTGTAILSTKGDQVGGAISILVDGLDDIVESDFLSETKLFASYAMSQTQPEGGSAMLGSTEKQNGHSFWVGTQMPVSAWGGKFGLEYNKGSKYWRSFTYAEDTMIGSKLATRGNAIEAYYTQPITESLSAQLRFTNIDYDYTGSNAFFGDGGTPMTIAAAKAAGMNPVESAQDIRTYIRYRF
ncbi:DUF3373 domain-containing protein [bacterium]|nr:DUF3373 domain-containing protein [bacterium]MBU1958990.1 DUF3373 domain-containing protein [bacterium]